MATITVTNSSDSGAGSLRAALAAASAGDTINFAPGVTTIDLASSLVISKNITIEGSQPGEIGTPGVTIDGGGQVTDFTINAGVSATLDGLIMADGYAVLPVCIKAGALEHNVPKRDLWISPHHAMYLDGELIEAKALVNGVSVVQAERVEAVEYFHTELDTHDVIIAEGALSETYLDDDNRLMFHNAPDYYARYREATAAPAHYCAPRLDDGYEVEAVRQRIAARAGLPRNADGKRPNVKVYRRANAARAR